MIMIDLWITQFSFRLFIMTCLYCVSVTHPLSCFLDQVTNLSNSYMHSFRHVLLQYLYVCWSFIYILEFLNLKFTDLVAPTLPPRLVWLNIFLISYNATVIHWCTCASFPREYQLYMLRNLPTPKEFILLVLLCVYIMISIFIIFSI